MSTSLWRHIFLSLYLLVLGLMPVNRVHDAKIKLYWHQLLQEQDAADPNRGTADALLKPARVPPFIPGMLLFPIPKAGPILGRIDVAFWAEASFVLGSILYLIDSFYLWHLFRLEKNDDAMTPGAIFNTAACAVFILNGIWCFVDWWLQYKQLSFLSLDVKEEYGGSDAQAQPAYLPKFSSQASIYYGCNNLFFLVSAIIFLVQAIWWENESTDLLGCYKTNCGTFWMNFWGTFLQFLSGVFAVCEYYDYCKKRNRRGLKPLKLFTTDPARFDWFGWGDWLYLIASAVGLLEAIDESYINESDDDVFNGLYLASNILFLVDSIIYLTGHILYMLELQNALKTGFLSEEQVATINSVMQEDLIEQEAGTGRDSSYIDESKKFSPRRLDIVNTSMTLGDAKVAYREFLFHRRSMSTSAITPLMISISHGNALSGGGGAALKSSIVSTEVHIGSDQPPAADSHRKSQSFTEGTSSPMPDFSSTVSDLIGSYTGSHGSYKSNMDSYMEKLSNAGGSLSSSPRLRGNSIIKGVRSRGNSVNPNSGTNNSPNVSSGSISQNMGYNNNAIGSYSNSSSHVTSYAATRIEEDFELNMDPDISPGGDKGLETNEDDPLL